VQINIGSRTVTGLLDSGSQASLINEVFNQLIEDKLEILTLGISNCQLQSAFGSKSTRIRKQALLPFKIDDCSYEIVALVAPKLTMDVILGINYLSEYNAVLNFEESCLVTSTGQRTFRHEFRTLQPILITAGIENGMSGAVPQCCNISWT
jgi:hypothetical protein